VANKYHRTWRDRITVKCFFFRHFLAFPNGLLSCILDVKRGAKSPGSLLIHLCPRRNSIDGHEEQLLWLDLPVKMLNIIEYRNEHLFLRHSEGRIVRVLVRAVVDDSIHVKVQGVELGYPILGDQL